MSSSDGSLSETELRCAARGLGIDAERLLKAVRDDGGLWLRPSPPADA